MLPIHLYGSGILEKVCDNVDLNDKNLSHIIKKMFKTLNKSNGIGLAAPQVGLNKRLFVINTNIIRELPKDEKIRDVFLNPLIISFSNKKISSSEGCLSIPLLSDILVDRYEEIKVSYYNQKLEYCEKTLRGKLAIVFQHEFDHLNGVLLTHKLSEDQKEIHKKDIENILLENQITYSFDNFEDILKYLMSLVNDGDYLSYPSCLA